MSGVPWTEREDDHLRRHWATPGRSIEDIAGEIGRSASGAKERALVLKLSRPPASHQSGWTAERVELLKKLWTDGLSASQIATQMGGLTRNAVIAKVDRLRKGGVAVLNVRAAPAAPTIRRAPAKVRAPTPPAQPKPARPMKLSGQPYQPGQIAGEVAPPTPVRRVEEVPGTATILTLGAHMCRWPIGDPQDHDFTLCGRRAKEKGSYCREHATVAYLPSTKKRAAAELARGLRRYV